MSRLVVSLFLMFLSLSFPAWAKWTPVDPKHDNIVRYMPSVCMMYPFGGEPTDPLYPGSHNNLVELNNDIYGASDNGNCAA